MRNRLIRAATALTAATTALLVSAAPAFACGGLVGENGTIQLTRTTTLAAYHDGVEHYMTSFEFSGEGTQVGSIVPLPGIPTTVERGGDWTLQRLQREVNPPPARDVSEFKAVAGSIAGPEIILQTKIDALEITVLKGGGPRSASGQSSTASCSRRTHRRSSTTTPAAARSSWPLGSTPPRRASGASAPVTARRST